MSVNLSSLATFTTGDDTVEYIIIPEQSVAFDDSAAVVVSDELGTFAGNDTIIVYGNFTMEGFDLDLVSLDIPSQSNVTGLVIVGDLFTDGTFSTPDNDDDVVIGAAQLVVPFHEDFDTSVYGIGSDFSSIRTGLGNDLVAGLALGSGADRAVGISQTSVDLGSGNDIVVGVGATSLLQESATAIGLDDSRITADSGSDIVVGAGVVSSFEEDSQISAVGISGGNVELETIFRDFADEDPSGSDVVLGLALGLGGEGVDMVGSAGISSGVIETGNQADLVAGIVAFASESGDTATLGGSVGLSVGHTLYTNDGADIVLGVVAGLFEGNGRIQDSFGIQAEMRTDDGDDQVIGVVLGAAEGQFFNADYAAGINGRTILTGSGDDLILGLVDFTDPDGIAVTNTSGIGAGNIDAGEDNDIVIGLGVSGSQITKGSDNYGISGTLFVSFDPDADINIQGEIMLGDGDDFIFARGASAGVNNVRLDGGIGNDVFDIHSGVAEILGGDDTDTLILSGDMDENSFEFGLLDVADDQLLEPTPMTVVISQSEVNFLEVYDIEFFVFDDGTYSYQELVDANTFDLA